MNNINTIKNRKFKVADLFGHSISLDIRKNEVDKTKNTVKTKKVIKTKRTFLDEEAISMGFIPNQDAFNIGLNLHLDNIKKID